jgi:CRP/FNR family transcriptional regulator
MAANRTARSKSGGSRRPAGPSVSAIDPWAPESPTGKLHQLLSEEEQVRLASIASVVRFKRGETIYAEGEATNAMFNIVSGVVATYHTDGRGDGYIAALLYPSDLFGLSEEGRYTNSAKALTSVTAYALPTSALRRLLSRDANLDFHFIVKLIHGLRQSQRHLFILSRKQAISRLALFLQMQEHVQASKGEATTEIYLPMSRSDIGNYVGLSLAAVSRAFHTLTEHGIISTRNRHHVKVLNRVAFDQLADRPEK